MFSTGWFTALILTALLTGMCTPYGGAAPEGDVVIFDIAPNTVECRGEMVQRCLVVRRGDAEEWTFFYDRIEGFEFEEGFRYRIEVEREQVANPPADGSSLKYRLLRVLSREGAAR